MADLSTRLGRLERVLGPPLDGARWRLAERLLGGALRRFPPRPGADGRLDCRGAMRFLASASGVPLGELPTVAAEVGAELADPGHERLFREVGGCCLVDEPAVRRLARRTGVSESEALDVAREVAAERAMTGIE